MGRMLICLFIAGIVAVGMVLALTYFALPYDGSWVLGTAGVVALLLWVITAKKRN